jgi:protein-S-isoprenylcysteine O-methyltransferase Ste14
MRPLLLKTLGSTVALHAAFTIGLPWSLLAATSDWPWARVHPGPVRWIGLLAVAFGAYVHLWALVRLLRRGTSALPGRTPTALETSGWYSRVRHPLLLGVVLILLGEAMAAGSWVLLAYAFAYWSWLNVFVARHEEPGLHAAFGALYGSYCRRVPRWIPRMGRVR